MNISIYCKEAEKHYLLTNKDLRVGDRVWPLTRGYTPADTYYVSEVCEDNFDIEEPHTIQSIDRDQKPHIVRTDHGYSRIPSYFKLVDEPPTE